MSTRPPASLTSSSGPTLLEILRARAAVCRYTPRTVQAYMRWVRVYIRFHGGHTHPRHVGPECVRAFLTRLAQERKVAASKQNQALAALTFLYRDALEKPLPSTAGIVQAKRPHRLPNVLSREEVSLLLQAIPGKTQLMAMLMYGAGLRMSECCELRLKNVDTIRCEIAVRQGKGARDRVTMLSASLRARIELQVAAVRRLMALRSARGGGFVQLPRAFERKAPSAARSWS